MEYTNIESIAFILDIILCIVGVAMFIPYVLDGQPKKKICHILCWAGILIMIIAGGTAFFLRFYPSVNLFYRSNTMKWIIFGMGISLTYGVGAILGIMGANRRRCK